MSEKENQEEVEEETQEQMERRLANRGTAQRNADYKDVYRATGDHKAAIRSYCAGNKWLTENAKAVGNW